MRRRDLLDFVRSWPVVIDVPSIDALVVHGGLFPGAHIDERTIADSRADLIRLRWVLYGHTPVDEPRVDQRAIGLDTGCVYGGSLTAAIYERGQWRTDQVRARRAYARS